MSRHHLHVPHTLGDHLADRVAGTIGSWRFIGFQAGGTLAWLVLNTIAYSRHWDPYPWILLNLVYSFQAGFTGPILLLAANRQAAIDRARDNLVAEEVAEIRAMLAATRAGLSEVLENIHAHRH